MTENYTSINLGDFIGTMYDGCRITKGKDILFFGNLDELQNILVYHFGITDFDKQSTDESYYESLLPESFKVEIDFNTNSKWFRENINYLANLEVKLNKQRDAYEAITADLSVLDKLAKLLDKDTWYAYVNGLYMVHQDLLADLGAKNQEEFRTVIKNLMVDDLQDTLDAIRGYTCDGVPVDGFWEDDND